MARKKNINADHLPSTKAVESFDMLYPMLNSALVEMREFSKKKQDGVINSLKVKIINRLLTDIKDILGSDSSNAYLETLDEDTLPQNSDAVLILGQYRASMNLFKEKYYKYDSYHDGHRWSTQEDPIS